MRLIYWIAFALSAGSLLNAAEVAKENLYTLNDGRVLRGKTAAEDKDHLTIEISVGSATAQVNVDKSVVREIHAAEAEQKPAEQAAQEPVPVAPSPDAAAWAMLKRAANTDQVDAESQQHGDLAIRNALINGDPKGNEFTPEDIQNILRALDKQPDNPVSTLRQAIDEANRQAFDTGAPFPWLRNPMPYDSDPTYWDVYSPLWQGVYEENFRGLTYFDGPLPRSRSRLQDLRDYKNFIFDNSKKFTSKKLEGAWIFPSGKDYHPYEKLPIPFGAKLQALPLGPNGGYPVAPYYQQDGVLQGQFLFKFPDPVDIIAHKGGFYGMGWGGGGGWHHK
ncbi:MAG: hypothetical protein HY291_23030 [Planctomycetes bacterium]|nr:hypothetical protein [Planctomycetota bacterium]